MFSYDFSLEPDNMLPQSPRVKREPLLRIREKERQKERKKRIGTEERWNIDKSSWTTGKDGKVRLGHRVGRNKHMHIEINRGRLVENDR